MVKFSKIKKCVIIVVFKVMNKIGWVVVDSYGVIWFILVEEVVELF